MFAKCCEILQRVLDFLQLQTNAVGLVNHLEDGIASRRLIKKVVDIDHLVEGTGKTAVSTRRRCRFEGLRSGRPARIFSALEILEMRKVELQARLEGSTDQVGDPCEIDG